MPMRAALSLLREHGIQATPQRIAVVRHVLRTHAHPSADEVWADVRRSCPTVSRATVYNTLNLLVDRGLLRSHLLREGTLVFDPHVAPHHHFVDEESGRIHDIPWDAVTVTGHQSLRGFDVREHEVVMRGRKRSK